MMYAMETEKRDKTEEEMTKLGVFVKSLDSKFNLLLEGFQALDKKIDDFRDEVNERFAIVDFKFKVVFEKCKEIDGKFEAMDKRFEENDRKFEVVFKELRDMRYERLV